MRRDRQRRKRGFESRLPFKRGGGDCGGLLFLERSWTADEWTLAKIKSQEAVRIPRNPDPNALPDFAGFVVTASEP